MCDISVLRANSTSFGLEDFRLKIRLFCNENAFFKKIGVFFVLIEPIFETEAYSSEIAAVAILLESVFLFQRPYFQKLYQY